MNETLRQYIESEINSGKKKDDIQSALIGEGWSIDDVEAEFSSLDIGDEFSDAISLEVTIVADPAFRGKVAIDNFRLLEWRPAPVATLPMWTEVDALRAAESQRFEVTVSGCRNV